MIRFKPPMYSGFVLSEVIIALALIGILIPAVLSLQSVVQKRIVKHTTRVDSLFALKKSSLLASAEDTTLFDASLTQRDPAITLQKQELASDSSLFRYKALQKKQFQTEYQTWNGRTKTINSVQYVVVVPEKEDEQPDKGQQ